MKCTLILHGSEQAFGHFFDAINYESSREPERLCLVSGSSGRGEEYSVSTEYPQWVRLLAIAAGLEYFSPDNPEDIFNRAGKSLREGKMLADRARYNRELSMNDVSLLSGLMDRFSEQFGELRRLFDRISTPGKPE